MTTLRRSNALYVKNNPKMPMRMSRSILVDGAEHVLSYGGTSQYNRNGTSASLAALNFARLVFSMEQGGLQDTALLQAVMTRECAEEATSICTLRSGNLRLEVEDICRIPLFEKTLKLTTTTHGLPGVSEFKFLLMELSNLDSTAVAIISSPPETIACLKLRIKLRSTTQNVFIIFDSHPRPSYPNGGGMIASTSVEGTARRLAELLRTVYLQDRVLQRQTDLPANYSGHVFVPHGVKTSAPTLWQAVLKSNLAQLSIQAEISGLRSQNGLLKSEQRSSESEIKDAETPNRRPKRTVQGRRRRRLGLSSGPSNYFDQPSAPPRHISSSTPHPSHPSSSIASTSTLGPFGPQSQPSGPRSVRKLPPIPPIYHDVILDSALYEMLEEFDNENRALSALRAGLAVPPRRLFACGICLEEMPDDSIVRLDPCGHTFCRDCLREYVATCLNERRFPILCPTCTASKGKGKGVAGEVSQALARDLGLNDKQCSIWTEMEISPFSILLHCRRCQRSMFVSRDEHEEVSIINCPLPDCDHAWCKQCQQSIGFNGPKHSCDGALELDYLMKQQGWKYCPKCKTPIQRVSGCNHMTCRTPGCNTHFCYRCGGFIMKSALDQVMVAVSPHRTKCQCM